MVKIGIGTRQVNEKNKLEKVKLNSLKILQLTFNIVLTKNHFNPLCSKLKL